MLLGAATALGVGRGMGTPRVHGIGGHLAGDGGWTRCIQQLYSHNSAHMFRGIMHSWCTQVTRPAVRYGTVREGGREGERESVLGGAERGC